MATPSTNRVPSVAAIPLVSTSCGLLYAIATRAVFAAFLKASHTDQKTIHRSVYLWWNAHYYEGLSTIMSIGLTTLISGIYTLQLLPRYSKPWYVCAAGLAFGVGHFTFAPKIVPVIDRLCDQGEEKKGKTLDWLTRWCQIHMVRTVVVDVPAVLAFGYLVFGNFA